MKYMRNMLLILVIMACWSGPACAADLWVAANDQFNIPLNNSAHAGQSYAGQSCTADPIWVVYGYNTYGADWHGCATCWLIQPPLDALDRAGKLNFPKKVCGERYTFKNIMYADGYFGSYVGQNFGTSAWNANYSESPTYVTIPWWFPGASTVTARYDRNAQVIQRTFVDYGYLADIASVWLPVGSTLPAYSAPNKEAQNKFYFEVDNHGGGWGGRSVTLSGVVAEMGDPTSAAPYSNHYIDWQYLSGTSFTATSDLPNGVTPTFTPAVRTAPFTGTKWLPSGVTTFTTNEIAAGTDAQWMAVGWSGTGRVPATGVITPGTPATVNLLSNSNASSINWNYVKHFRTKFANNSSDPWVKSQFDSLYRIKSGTTSIWAANTSAYWTPNGSSTITIPEKISRLVDLVGVGRVEELWVLDKAALALPAWATLSYNSATGEYNILQTQQSAPYTYNVVYNKLSVSVTGVDTDNLPKLQGLAGFTPRPAATSLTSGLNDMTLSAPNVLYADYAGKPNTLKYVLTGWSGTGSIPLSGNASLGANTTIPVAIAANSTITWKYSKQIRVTTTTTGENNPIVVYDLPGDVVLGSNTITNIVTSWTETVDENGIARATPVTKSLMPGMLVVGNGIPAGTTITTVNLSSLILSNPATLTYVAANGQLLSFSTFKAFETPASTVINTALASGVTTTGLIADLSVSGPGIEDGTTITGVDAVNHQLTLSSNASVTSSSGLYFGSADPRQCMTINDFTPANCAVRSGINFYPLDTSVFPNTPLDLVDQVNSTALNQFVEAELGADGSPTGNTVTRTLSQVVNTSGAALGNIPLMAGARKVIKFSKISMPMDVTWRYDSTKIFVIGEPIKPPPDTDLIKIDREKPPTIVVGTPTLPGDTVDLAFIKSWDTSMDSITPQGGGSTTTGSTIIGNLTSTSGLTPGMFVYGSGIPDSTIIVSVDSPSQVTLNNAATQTGSAIALTFQSRQGERYFPIHPVNSFTIKWPRMNTLVTHDETGTAVWPNKQPYIAGVPANLNPLGAVNTFHTVSYSPNQYTPINGVFQPVLAGTYVLRFTTPPVLPDLRPGGAAFIVVESSLLRTEMYKDNPVEVGKKIEVFGGHSDPENKSGYLYFADADYDGVGADRAYDRDSRTGTIIPVNKTLPTKPLMVVWYKTGAGGIGWPTSPKRYKADWPATPKTITIGNGEPVSETAKPRAMVYNQPDVAKPGEAAKPGFNPNEEHALLTGGTLYALRNDLNAISNLSEPYVLLKYKNPTTQEWAMDVYKVERQATYNYPLEVGKSPSPPLPPGMERLDSSGIKKVNGAEVGGEWHLLDKKDGHWAKAANWKDGDGVAEADKSSFVMKWYYKMDASFYWPATGYGAKKVGDSLPFLHDGSATATYADGALPVDVTYVTEWPATAPVLGVGDTLTGPRKTASGDLPDLYNFMTAEVIYDENVHNGGGPLAKLYAPVRSLYYNFPLADQTAVAAIVKSLDTEVGQGAVLLFTKLPFAIQTRLFYDSINKRLGFKGVWLSADGQVIAQPVDSTDWLFPNLMTATERETIKGLSSDAKWTAAVDALYSSVRNPNSVTYPATLNNPFKTANPYNFTANWGIKLGLMPNGAGLSPVPARSIIGEKNALTAGMAQGEGYVVIAENNSAEEALKGSSVALHVVRISKTPVFQGVIKALKSKNVFDEKLTLHYTGDFGGEPENFTFDWSYQPVNNGMPDLPASGAATGNWKPFTAYKKDSSGSLVVNNDPGQTDITIEGASTFTMSDNWFVARYSYKDAWPTIAVSPDPGDGKTNWSLWSGANKFDTPMLAMGWIKRVVDALNPLEARVTDFRNSATNTTVSMLSQFGSRYEGPVAFSNDPAYLNSLGLISAYETVLNRGRQFSIDAVPAQNYGPTNDALLNISSRLATFYLALGNEAYADAVDPTIGFSTKSAEYGNMAPSVFAFQNQADSLLEEELALMRGRDDSAGSTKNVPYYNRLIWNFTQGEGEVAYAQNYNITDQNGSGVIDAADAKSMYPQGHGDAWGHYLQSISYYYKLLGHKDFSWEPRVEFVMVAGEAIMVDYLDERKFASIAAARAKTGAEILDLTYKQLYTDDPAGQWQGYKDSFPARAWGVDEWARRAGQAALFDWATANALLPDSVPATGHDRVQNKKDINGNYEKDPITGLLITETLPGNKIQQIDRSKAPELQSIASQFHRMQAKMVEVDGGINPLGLVKGVVPFDIDPMQVDAGKTHFEQVYERAEKALANAVASYDYANGYTQRLRQNQDTLADFKKNLTDQERDYKNRLIEIFGYPYADDIGPGKIYPDGYDGPDIIHYNYVDKTDLTGKKPSTTTSYKTYTATYKMPTDFLALGLSNYTVTANSLEIPISYNINTDDNWIEKPTTWTTKRRAPGRIQQAMSGLILTKAAFDKAYDEFEGYLQGIDDAKKNLEERYGVLSSQILVQDQNEGAQIGLDATIFALHATSVAIKRVSSIYNGTSDGIAEALPKVLGMDNDALAPARGTVKTANAVVLGILDTVADVVDVVEFGVGQVKERMDAGRDLKLAKMDANYEVSQAVKEFQNSMSEIDSKLAELYALKETMQQAAGSYQAALAEGLRLMDERAEKRAQSAANVQEYRFQDLGFRVFRNDAIQKYRAQFDLAAKYVYLAATAYDYETNLLGSASGAGRKFLSEIARQSTLGVISNGTPQAGFPGLADVMARLSQNFSVYKTQLGFNNPQTETTPFSLRTELFRIQSDATSKEDWKNVLKDHKVDDLWKIPEFKRYCRPFAPESAGAQPGIVIKFPTTVTYGKNFFGWPLSGGDSAYSTSNFATRVRSVGLWFQNYNGAGLSSTPRVYLVPTGADILRSPTGNGFATREWQVQDQKLPVPFPLGDSDLKNPDFIPVNDSLSDEMAGIRRVSDFRAYPYSGAFNPGQATSDSRLVGRSVWNSQWMLIIPGSTLLFNKDAGLNSFIDSVDDIKMFFQTYAYSGN